MINTFTSWDKYVHCKFVSQRWRCFVLTSLSKNATCWNFQGEYLTWKVGRKCMCYLHSIYLFIY